MDKRELELQIKQLDDKITKNNNIIDGFKKIKILLNDKGLVDEELINIIDNNIKKSQDYNIKHEELRINFIYELLG
jgi:hypothetical protein